jgi:hypothetical protein
VDRVDWVLEGRKMKPQAVEKLAAAVAGLLRDLPPYPVAQGAVAAAATAATDGGAESQTGGSRQSPSPRPVFAGRGVVMVGGGLRYLTPAWTSLHVLRKTGESLLTGVWCRGTPNEL